MGETAVLPVVRFSPAPGLWVDRTETSVSITGQMEMFGPEANAARAQSVEHTINQTWTSTFPDGYAVSCNVSVRYRAPSDAAGNVAQIEVVAISGPSSVNSFTHNMTLNSSSPDVFTWTAAHEFGHVLGLDDRYSEGIMSTIRGRFGGTRANTVDPRYQGNLMAVHGGVLEGKNVQDIAVETAPSEWWINDDDQVLAWVNHHSLADVGRLTTANKLRAIHTLMGGWISDEDVAGIARICSSVTTGAEATAIRNGVDLLEFSSIGQRTAVRVAFARMP